MLCKGDLFFRLDKRQSAGFLWEKYEKAGIPAPWNWALVKTALLWRDSTYFCIMSYLYDDYVIAGKRLHSMETGD